MDGSTGAFLDWNGGTSSKSLSLSLPLEDELLEDSEDSDTDFKGTVLEDCLTCCWFGIWGEADRLRGFGVPARKKNH